MTAERGEDAGRWAPLELWSLREDVQAEIEEVGPIRLRSRWGDATIAWPSPHVREAVSRMRLGPISLRNVISAAQPAVSGEREAARWEQVHQVLSRLQPLIVRSLAQETGQPMLTVVPMTPRSRFQPRPVPAGTPVMLSTFAQLRTNGHEYVLESPLALHRVLLHRAETMQLIAALGRPTTPAELAGVWSGHDLFAAGALAYLVAAGMVVQGRPSGDGENGAPLFADEASLARTGWSPVDLMFHTRSTVGRHDQDLGATYPSGETTSPEPVIKPRQAGHGIELSRPSWQELCVSDPPLIVAMEGRRSVRDYAAGPMTVEQLGGLLYRTARVRSLIGPSPSAGPRPGAAPEAYGLSDRPYPSGGACYELELYVTVGRCNGLPSGAYHYDPLGHRLEPLDADGGAVDVLLDSARLAAAMDSPPPVLITMTARFGRLSWKYAGISYALALMHAGVLTQSLYLVCTAMRLAPCAIGLVRTDVVAGAFGTDWRLEPSIGQFAVGPCADGPAAPAGRGKPVNDVEWARLAREQLADRQGIREPSLSRGSREPAE